MRITESPRFLPAVLWVDAASAAASGALQLAVSGPLARWLGLPQPLLLASGGVLLLVAAYAAWLAGSRPASRAGVLALAGLNAAWVLGCLDLLLSGTAGTAFGTAWLVLQAVAVGLLAELEWLAVRRHAGAAMA